MKLKRTFLKFALPVIGLMLMVQQGLAQVTYKTNNTSTANGTVGTVPVTDVSNNGTTVDRLSGDVTPVSFPMIGLSKTASVPAIQANGSYNLVYTFLVQNYGAIALKTVQVTDALNTVFTAPVTYTVTSLTASGTLSANTAYNGNSDINLLLPASSTLATGASGTITLTINVVPNATYGTYNNSATATAVTDDVSAAAVSDLSTNNASPNHGDNTKTPVNFNDPTPVALNSSDIEVVKTIDNLTPNTGSQVTFTIKATNLGVGDAAPVVLNDIINNTGYDLLNAIPSVGVYDNTTGVWNIGLLTVGSEATLTVTAIVLPDKPASSAVNTASSNHPGDPVIDNNSSTVSPVPVQAVDLRISNTDNKPVYVPGTTNTYTVEAINDGPSNAPGSTVTFSLPAGITSSWTATYLNGATGNATGSGNINELVNLPPNSRVTYTITTGTIPSDQTGNFIATATVTAPTSVTDVALANNTAVDSDTRIGDADLTITNTDGQPNYVPGVQNTYTIVATNNGISDVNGASVTVPIPAGLTGTWTAVYAGGATGASNGTNSISEVVNIPVGATVTYTLVMPVPSTQTGTITLVATINPPSGTVDPVANNTATDIDIQNSTGDLSITNTDGKILYVPGNTNTYTVVATNPGPSDAVGANITFPIPAGVTGTWSAIFTGGALGVASGTGNINETVTMPSGSTVTYIIIADIPSNQTDPVLTTTATIIPPASFNDPDLANNAATDTDTRIGGADLSITNTDGKTTYTPGTSTAYTVVATNNGPSDVTGATVTFPIPPNAVATWTATYTGGASGAASGSNSINQSVNMPAGSSVTYMITGAIPSSQTGDLSFTATISLPAGSVDPNPADNSATDTDTQNSEADLTITNTDNKLVYTPGISNTYTVTASNTGPSDAPGSTVTYSLPVGTTGSWTAVYTGGASGTAAGTNNINQTVNLPSGGKVVYTVVVSIPSSQTGLFTTTATVAPATGINDLTPTNNTANDTDLKVGDADLSITNSDAKLIYTPGVTNTYTVVATNTGPSDVPNANVTYTLPTGITGSWTAVFNGGASGNANGSNNINETVNIPVGGRITYTVVVPVPSGQTGADFNTVATVSTPFTITDPIPDNNTATDRDLRVGNLDLSITNTDGKTNYIPGVSNTYTILATNNGPSDVTGATISYPLPAGTTASWNAVFTGGATGTASGTSAINQSVNMPVGSTITYTLNLTIPSNITGALSTTASIAVPAGSVDPTPANNSATDTDDQSSNYDLSITNTDTKVVFTPGTSNTYTVVVSNAGPSDAIAARVNYILPGGVGATWTAAFAGGASGTATGTNNINQLVNVPVGGTITYTIIAAIPSSQLGASLTTTATVTPAMGATDPTLANNTATDVDLRVGATDLSITNTDNQLVYIPGVSNSYTVVATNNGPSDVLNANIAYQLPAGVTATWTAVYTGGATGNGNGINNANQLVSMPAGSTITYTVIANIPAGQTGPLTTTATISVPSGTIDITPANNTASDTDLQNSQADLSITNTDGKLGYGPGTTNTYTVVASNTGPSNVTGATVSYTLPAGINSTWTAVYSGGATGTANGSNAINETVNMPAGSTITYTVVVPIPSNATAPEFVTVAAIATPTGVGDPTPANNTARDIDLRSSTIDLSITNTDNKISYVPGTTNTYTVVGTNIGPADAVGATVTYNLPSGVTSTWTAVYNGGATGVASGTNAINETVNIPAGGTVTYTIVATIPSNQTGPLTTVAAIAGTVTDPTPGDNTATDIDTQNSQTDLAITNTDNKPTYTPGTSNTYIVVVSNTGPSDAVNAAVRHTLPAGITTSWTVVFAGGASGNASGSGSINEFVNVPVGATATYTIVANIPASQTGSVTANASVTPAPGVTDPTPANNTATDIDVRLNNFDLSITNTDGKATYSPGTTNTYTLVAGNSGPSDITGARITYPQVTGVTYTWTAVFGTGATGTASGTGSINELVNIPAGSNITYTVIATIISSKTGDLTTAANISAPINITDPELINNTATDTDNQRSVADLSITNTDGKTNYVPGTTNTYTIVASNIGPSDAPGTIVSYNLPPGFTGTWTAANSGGASGTPSGTNSISATVNLPAGASVTYTVVVNVPAAQTSPFTTTATIAPAAGITDPVLTNNTANDTDSQNSYTDLRIVKTASSPSVYVNSQVSFTLVVTNNGPSAATNVSVTDLLPSGFTYVSSVAGQGSYAPTTGVWTIGNMANAATANLTVVARVNATGNYTNISTVTGAETDVDLTNNTSQVTIVAQQLPVANNDAATTNPNTPIPIAVLTNDVKGFADLNPGSVVIVQQPANGTLSINNANGVVTYSPVTNYYGTDQFTYTVKDVNGQVSNVATVNITINDFPVIGLAKAVTSAVKTINGAYNITYLLTVGNYGSSTLNTISITDNLSQTFKGQQYRVTSITSLGKLLINTSYNGTGIIEMLQPGNTLTVGQIEQIQIVVNVIPLDGQTVFLNSAFAQALSVTGLKAEDQSTDGLKPDPNTAGDVSPLVPTPVQIDKCQIRIPGGFSPNSDGVHDNFVIEGTCAGVVNLEIYNRWGNLVYRDKDYKNDWKGICNQGVHIGEELPVGTYYYIIVLDGKDRYVGYLTLNR